MASKKRKRRPRRKAKPGPRPLGFGDVLAAIFTAPAHPPRPPEPMEHYVVRRGSDVAERVR